jgi:hypothetical protein
MTSSKKYPCHNTSLSNLPLETWNDLPAFEDLYQISCHGRIKSLPRLIEIPHYSGKTTMVYWTKERIRKIKVHTRWNSVVQQNYYECTISLNLGRGRERTFLVHRMVYQAFVKEIDFDSDRLMVMHKDGDGLNNHYSNLVAGSRNDVSKNAYHRKRHISPFALKTKIEVKNMSQKAALARQKRIIQYSLEGKQLCIFTSIKEASMEVGIPSSNLTRVLKKDSLTAGGFIWRYYPSRKKISTDYIRKRKASKITQSRKAIKQYSFSGRLLRTFRSISEAALKMKIAPCSISNCLAGRTKQTGGYIWRVK